MDHAAWVKSVCTHKALLCSIEEETMCSKERERGREGQHFVEVGEWVRLCGMCLCVYFCVCVNQYMHEYVCVWNALFTAPSQQGLSLIHLHHPEPPRAPHHCPSPCLALHLPHRHRRPRPPPPVMAHCRSLWPSCRPHPLLPALGPELVVEAVAVEAVGSRCTQFGHQTPLDSQASLWSKEALALGSPSSEWWLSLHLKSESTVTVVN